MKTRIEKAIYILIDHIDQSDVDLVQTLIDKGYSATQADRVVAFAPIVFGRQILQSIENVSFSAVFILEIGAFKTRQFFDYFDEYNGLVTLAHELRENQVLSKSQFMSIANKSCEISVASNILNSLEENGLDASLEALSGTKFSENHLWGFEQLLTDEELVEVKNNITTCLLIMRELLEAHGIATEQELQWIKSKDHGVSFSFDWLPSSNRRSGQLNVNFKVSDNQTITESFAGIGDDAEEGITNAFHNFSINSLHVILDAFMNQSSPNDVMRESWIINEQEYEAYIGNFGTKAMYGEHPGLPESEDLFELIEKTVKAEVLDGDIHAIRLYCGHTSDDDIMLEALLDNEVWPNGLKTLQGVTWRTCPHFYSVRLFMILKKKNVQKPSMMNRIKQLFS